LRRAKVSVHPAFAVGAGNSTVGDRATIIGEGDAVAAGKWRCCCRLSVDSDFTTH